MSDDGSDGGVIGVHGQGKVIKRLLQDSRRKHDRISEGKGGKEIRETEKCQNLITVRPRYTGLKNNGNPPITNVKPRSL